MTTLNTICYSVLRALGVIYQGQTPSATQITQAQEAINIALMSVGNTVLYATTTDTLTFTANKASYSIGSSLSADWNTGRPNNINYDLSYVQDGDDSYDIYEIGQREYNDIVEKATGGRPYQMYYDPQAPLGYLYFYFTPDAAYSLHLVSEKPFSEITNLMADIALPNEYLAFLKWVGAKYLAADYPGAAAQANYQGIILPAAKSATTIIQGMIAANKVEQVKLDVPTVKRRSVMTPGGDPDMGNEL